MRRRVGRGGLRTGLLLSDRIVRIIDERIEELTDRNKRVLDNVSKKKLPKLTTIAPITV